MANINKAQVNGTNRTKSTISFWVNKRVTADQKVFQFKNGSAEYLLKFKSNDEIHLYSYNGSSYIGRIETNRVFRDTAAWYHFVIQVDTTDNTASNRFRFYVNGDLQDNLKNETQPSQDATFELSTSSHHLYIGSQSDGGDAFAGNLAHFHYTDGYSYAPTVFGETDSTSGVWVPKTAPSVTYGTNGFFLKFANSGNLDLDSSPNNLTFTTSGTLTQRQSSPTNLYNALNFAASHDNSTGISLSNCNTSFNSGNSINYALAVPNMAFNKGKWYFETKIGHPCAAPYIGDTHEITERIRGSTAVGTSDQEFAWEGNGYMKTNGGQSAYGNSASASDIIGMYVDLDNNKLYIGINGTIQNSGTGYSITDPDSLTSGFYYVGGISDQCSATANVTADMNYGDGFFGTTAVASAQSDANGHGIFEYSPNDSGGSSFDGAAKNFYAMNTENMKEFG